MSHMAAHGPGAAAYAAKAVGLASGNAPTAVEDEVRWQQSHTTPAVRDILRRLSPPPRAPGMLGALINDLHLKLGTRG